MSSYHLMIVDDERTTRQGLLALPMWQALGVVPVAQAEDGDVALAQMQATAPDILLTDVKMPRMDGIALAREAKKLLPELKVLFVSGYDDVAYLRSALKMGACDYICKPIDLGELEECMRRILGEVEEARALRRRMQALTLQSQRSAPVLRQQLLRDLLDPTADEAALREQQALVGVRLDDAYYAAFCLELDNCQGAQAALGSEALLEFAVQNIAEELLAEAFPQVLVGVVLSPSRYVALLGAPEPLPAQRLTALAALLRDTVEQCLHVSASVGIGPWVTDLHAFSQAYDAAARALLHRLHLGKNQVIPHDSPLIAPVLDGGGGHETGFWDAELEPLFLREDDAALRTFLRDRFARWAALHRTDLAFYQAQAGHLVYSMHAVLCTQVGENDEELLAQPVVEQICTLETLEDMAAVVTGYAMDIFAVIRLKNDSGTSLLIAQAKAFIEQHYAQNLSIQEIAQHVYISPTYLCLLFRQQTGTTVNAYLTQVRMERAKELLCDLSNKLYDISFAVGYSNPSYFSRQFKKHTGLLPSDWRNQRAGRTGGA